jgi:hypothetical protein
METYELAPVAELSVMAKELGLEMTPELAEALLSAYNRGVEDTY